MIIYQSFPFNLLTQNHLLSTFKDLESSLRFRVYKCHINLFTPIPFSTMEVYKYVYQGYARCIKCVYQVYIRYVSLELEKVPDELIHIFICIHVENDKILNICKLVGHIFHFTYMTKKQVHSKYPTSL